MRAAVVKTQCARMYSLTEPPHTTSLKGWSGSAMSLSESCISRPFVDNDIRRRWCQAEQKRTQPVPRHREPIAQSPSHGRIRSIDESLGNRLSDMTWYMFGSFLFSRDQPSRKSVSTVERGMDGPDNDLAAQDHPTSDVVWGGLGVRVHARALG